MKVSVGVASVQVGFCKSFSGGFRASMKDFHGEDSTESFPMEAFKSLHQNCI